MKIKWQEILRGLRIGFLLGIAFGMIGSGLFTITQGCASVHPFDPKTGAIDTTKGKLNIPSWAVDEHYDEMIKALKENKKLKVIYVKKENPIAAWTLGAGMIIGGLLVLIGIGVIVLSEGARLWRGLLICVSGVATYVTFYMIDKYLVWICVGFTVILVGAFIYFFFFARGMIDKSIETNDMQKGQKWTDDLGKEAKKLQGSLQDPLSRRWKRLKQKKERLQEKAEKKIAKLKVT